MDNKEQYQKIFIESLSIESKKFNDDIKYNEIPEWDSIGHMTLMSGLEEGFKIALEWIDLLKSLLITAVGGYFIIRGGEKMVNKYKQK